MIGCVPCSDFKRMARSSIGSQFWNGYIDALCASAREGGWNLDMQTISSS